MMTMHNSIEIYKVLLDNNDERPVVITPVLRRLSLSSSRRFEFVRYLI